MILGIDIASVDGNKPIDWVAAKRAGVRFAIFRGNYGTWEDPTWARETDRARAVGLVVGAYIMPVFAVGAPDPEVQMQAFARHVSCCPSDLPPTIDVEFSSIGATGRTRSQLLAWILRAVRELRRLFGVWPQIYTSTRVWEGEDADTLDADAPAQASVDMSECIECPLWLAWYPWRSGIAPQVVYFDRFPWPPVPKLWGIGNVWIHQEQGDAIGLPGFTNTVDLNRFHLLALGSTGERVRWVERKLGLAPTGLFDDAVRQAVIAFQRDRQLEADGVIGPVTFARLCWQRASDAIT